jgi:hypothetical protein
VIAGIRASPPPRSSTAARKHRGSDLAARNNQMIVQADAEASRSIRELAGNTEIAAARLGVAGRVIVRDYDTCRASADCVKHNAAQIELDGIWAADREDFVIDQSMARVQEQNDEAFVAAEADDALQEMRNACSSEGFALA